MASKTVTRSIILAITNLETELKKCSVQYFLNCSYRLGRLKRQQTSEGLRFLHRSYINIGKYVGTKKKWRVAHERKTGATAKHLLKQTADCTALQSQIYWTIEPLSQKSQIAQKYGLLPADARQQSRKIHFLGLLRLDYYCIYFLSLLLI